MSDELKRLWETGTPVRENFYSRTRRNSFSVNDGIIREHDIQRIQIPFPSVMEKKLQARFQIRDEDLSTFYQTFQRELGNHAVVADSLRSVGDRENIDSATMYYEMSDLDQLPNGGYDVYFVTPPAMALMDSKWLSDTGAMYSSILTIGARLLQSVRAYNNAGFSLGALDMSSIMVTEENGTTFIKNAFFLAATAAHGNQNAGGPAIPSAVLRTHMAPNIQCGEASPSYNGDIYSVCSILWTMLSGQHPSVSPNLNVPPQFCTEKLAALLVDGMTDGVATYKELQREIRMELNALADGSMGDRMITFAVPFYFPEFDALDKKEEERIAEEKKAAEAQPEDDKKKKLLSTIIIGVVGLLAIMLSYFFYIKPILFPAPEPEPTPVVTPIPTPKPTPTPDPDAGRPDTNSAEVGLYTYGELILDKYGNPSTRFYVNEDGDIVCEPSKFPSRYSELEFTDIVHDLRGTDFAGDASGKTMQVKPEEIAKYGLDEGLLLLPPGWDMTKHLPRIGGVSFTPEEAFVKTFLRYAATEEKKPTAARVEIDRSRLEGLDSEDAVKEFYTALMAEALNATMTDDKAAKWKEQLDVSGLHIDIDLSGSEWYEQYKCCDDATHQKLMLLEREPETEKIKTRVSHANGADITLYYDDAGNTYTEDDWEEQEELRTAIEETKAELDSYKSVEGVTILVPYWAVDEYVFVEEFRFGADPLVVELNEDRSGNAIGESFMATIQMLPENATCKEVEAEFNRSSGLSVPYSFNSDYVMGEHSTYEDMTAMTLDFSACSDGKMALAMDGSEFGRYKLKLTSKDGHATGEMAIELQNNGAVPTPTPEPTPTPTSAPAPAATPAPPSGGGQSYTPVQPQLPISTPAPVVCTPEPTPVPTPSPAPAPSLPDDDTLTVTPKELKMKVGETYDLKPSLSCSWSCSAPSVASVGGSQGRTVTAKSAGTCEITARSSDGQTFTVTVTVTD